MKEKFVVKKKKFEGLSKPPDDLAQNVSKQILFGRIIPPFFLRTFRI